MSWLAEEWKEKLPTDALTNIQTMENTLENLHKDLSQYQFKIESLEASLENSKQKLEEKIKENQTLEREKFESQSKLEEEIARCNNLSTNLKQKEDIIHDYTSQVSQLKERIDLQKVEKEKLENDLENLKTKYGMDSEQAKDGKNRLNEAHEISKQRIDELKHQLEEVTKDRRSEEIAYEQRMQTAFKKEKELTEMNENLYRQISSLQLQHQAVETEKNKIETQLEELQEDIYRFERHQPNDGNKMQDIIKKKDFEIQDLKKKLTSMESQGHIGAYLGIDVKKICSETQLRENDRPTLILQNKALQEEVRRLTHLLKSHTSEDCMQCLEPEFKVGEKYLHTAIRQQNEDNFDSGLALKADSIHDTDCNKEVLISRLERSSAIMRDNNNENNEAQSPCVGEACEDVDKADQFQHSSNCALGAQKLFESNAVMNSYKSENKKLKQEIHQMKDVYENHMKICGHNKLTRKSVEKMTTEDGQNNLVEDLQRKLSVEEQTKKDLLMCLQEQESKCMLLENKLSLNENISTTAVNKLEDLVDVILQQRSNTYDTENIKLPPDIERILAELTNSFVSMHEEIVEGNELTRESICKSTDTILHALRYEHDSNVTKERLKNNTTRQGGSYYKNCIPRNGIEELEHVKESIEGVQQTIYEYGCEIRKVEEERNRLQEELIRMVEMMKTKDEEYGRLSCLYEDEKRKVDENDSCYHREMQAIKTEQLEIYQEYREMCDKLKKKEIELLNKTKQMKLLSAEWRDKEDNFNDKILQLQQECSTVTHQNQELQKHLEEKSIECDLLISRLVNSEEQLQTIFNNLSRIEDMFYKAKTEGLYN